MIELAFLANSETFRIKIIGKEIYYCDRLWKGLIRMIPKDEKLIKKIMMSRNRIPSYIIPLFELTRDEFEEYDKANNEEELAAICIRDAAMRGGKLIKKTHGESEWLEH